MYLISFNTIFKKSKTTCKCTKRLLWIPEVIAFAGSIVTSFPSYKKKHPISILCQITEPALRIFRHRKTLLKHLTFCFSFSLKHILSLLCSLWMLQQLWCPYVTIHPQAMPCPGQSHCSKLSFICRWNSCIPVFFVHDYPLSMSVECCF